MKSMKKIWFAVIMTAVLPLLATCGGSDPVRSGGNGSNARYSLGGTVSGLDGTLILLNGSTNARTIYINGAFTLATSLANGTAYDVTVYSKPINQTCTVSNGSGTINSANVTNIQVACAYVSGVTLSGKIAVPPGVMVDGTVNDPSDDYVPNDTFDKAQVLPNPISVGGFVNRRWTGDPSGWLYPYGNPDDYYLVQLKAGDIITLASGSPNPRDNDIDLYLYDNNKIEVDYSIGTGTYEFIEVKSDGVYFVNVYAYSGASNYILTIGADAATAAIAASDAGILSSQREIVPDQVVVRLKDSVKTAAASSLALTQFASDLGLTPAAGSPEREMLLNIDDLKFQTYANKPGDERQKSYEGNASGNAGNFENARLLNTLRTIKELRRHPDVLYAEPNYIVRTYRSVNDAYYGYQWNLPLINMPEAWDITTGSDDVIVAVIDTGVLLNHPDLSGRLTGTGYDFVDKKAGGNDPGDKEPGTSRSSFHGTHVAGIIAAATNNNLGVAGITWKTKILPVRVMGVGGRGNTYDVRQGMRYAAGLSNDSGIILPESSRADIINLSLGASSSSASDQALITELRSKGIIVVAAAGNENTSTPSYPAAYNGVIAVSAVNINSTKASYSNYGSYIDVAAPGGDSGDYNGDGYQDYVLSAGADDSSGSIVNAYVFQAGTSMAAPHVAGVAALMKAVYPGMLPEDMDVLLAAGNITNDIGTPGKDNIYGYGLINAYKAVMQAQALHGGAAIAGLDVNPRYVNLGLLLSETSITVSKIGTGELSVTTVEKNADWLTVTPDTSVDGNGFGNYTLSVDRPSLTQEGAYTGIVTFTSSSGTSVSVNVTVQVSFNNAAYTAGYHYVLLIKMNDAGAEEGGLAYPAGKPKSSAECGEIEYPSGCYEYSFRNVPPGQYLILAGSDRNNDGYIGDGGEFFGAYPTVNQMVMITVANSNINNLSFTTNLILPISTSSIDADSMAAADKQYALQPEFKLLR